MSVREAWLGLVLALSGCGQRLPVATLTVGDTPLTVEVAATEAHRAKGLMHRDALPEDRGMLFVYPDTAVRGFWMKNTRIPLSIAYIEADGTIARIAHMKPHDTTRVSSLYPVRYAIEVNEGWFERHGVKKGDVVKGLDEAAP